MGRFFAVGVDRDDADAGAMSAVLRRSAEDAGWAVEDLNAGTWLAVTGPHPPSVTAVGPWRLVGQALHRAHRAVDPVSESDPWAYERKILSRFWGGYVGLRFRGDGPPDAVLRDPSGVHEALVWVQGGMTMVGSHLPDFALAALKPNWVVRYDRVLQALHAPLLTGADLLIDGPVTVLPGAVQLLPPTGRCVSLWTPAGIFRSRRRPGLSIEGAAEGLRQAVDDAVAGLAKSRGVLAAEVSGGLDSSIVAASLRVRPDVALWLNAWGPDAEADERDFVATLARVLDITPTSVPRAAGLVTEGDLLRISQDIRPGVNALDFHHDQDWADRLTAAGAEAVMTGKGGDSVFIQAATGAVFSDLWRERGWRALLSPALPRLAAWNERSVWSLILEARRQGRSARPRSNPDVSLLTPLPTHETPSRHPWLEDCDDLGPAKTYQIAGVVAGVMNHGFSVQHTAAQVLHPLLSQPVVEACLALPTPLLTLGRRDRALARLAFGDRLPREIAERRSKGEMTAFYGRMVADSLDVLRPWLIEGRLAQEGIIDQTAAETLLTRASLAWRGGYGEIMVAAAFEGWVRSWEAKLSTRH